MVTSRTLVEMDEKKDILIAIPCYRDAVRLREFLPGLLRELASMPTGGRVRVQVVDDGSEADAVQARELVEDLRRDFPFLDPLRALSRNAGKGSAVYAAWDGEREAEWLAFVDADGAVPASEVRRLCELALGSAAVDAVIASRVQLMGRHIARQFHRHLVGRIHATLATALVGLVVYDSQCGCKLVRRTTFARVRDRLQETRFSFDLELLCQLAAAGGKIREEPLWRWTDVPGSKVRLGRDSWRMFRSLLRLRGRLAPAVRRRLRAGGE